MSIEKIMNDTAWNNERERLEVALSQAAFHLMLHTGASKVSMDLEPEGEMAMTVAPLHLILEFKPVPVTELN
jgi:hypothetical protein